MPPKNHDPLDVIAFLIIGFAVLYYVDKLMQHLQRIAWLLDVSYDKLKEIAYGLSRSKCTEDEDEAI